MKKILLLGEYSGLHKNLKSGLQHLGYDVTFASAGDGKKKIYGDIDLTLKSVSKIGKFKELKHIISNIKDYDIVQFINPYISHPLAVFAYEPIYKNNDQVFCVAAGDDVEFLKFTLSGGMQEYSVFDEYLERKLHLEYTSLLDLYLHNKFMKNIKGVIPAMWEYAESYRQSKFKSKLTQTIPLSMDLESNLFEDNIVQDKLVFYHASNRPLFKGSASIIKAMEIFQAKYPNDVEMIVADFLPLNEYLEVLSKTNVVIDQCRSYSYGMNAIYAGAKGKIVMSGSEEVAIKELGIEETPIINITPNVKQIIQQFEMILDNKNNISEMSINTREYVEKYHDSIKIAKMYLRVWGIEK